MDILVKNMELTQLMDIFNEAGVRYYKNGEPIEFEIFHNDVGPIKHGQMSDYTKPDDYCSRGEPKEEDNEQIH